MDSPKVEKQEEDLKSKLEKNPELKFLYALLERIRKNHKDVISVEA